MNSRPCLRLVLALAALSPFAAAQPTCLTTTFGGTTFTYTNGSAALFDMTLTAPVQIQSMDPSTTSNAAI